MNSLQHIDEAKNAFWPGVYVYADSSFLRG